MGAAKGQLFRQFIGESVFGTAIGVILAIGFAFLLLPAFNQLAGKTLQFTALLDPVILGCIILLGVGIGFAAGAYPALLLSGIKLAKILKSGFSFTSGQGVRKIFNRIPVCYFNFPDYNYSGYPAAAFFYPQ